MAKKKIRKKERGMAMILAEGLRGHGFDSFVAPGPNEKIFRVLIGPLPAGGLLAGMLCAAVYLTFAVAVTALATSLTTSTVASVGITLAILLAALPLLGDVHAISSWVPTTLVGAPADLVASPPTDDLAHFVPALGVCAAAGALALAAAVRRLQARET